MSSGDITIRIHYFNSATYPNILQSWHKTVDAAFTYEDVIKICCEEILECNNSHVLSAHAFPFFGLQLALSSGERYWPPPNRSLETDRIILTDVNTQLFFKFRFKPAPSVAKIGIYCNRQSCKHYGFRALLQQSLLLQDNLWNLLHGQFENELEIETLNSLLEKKDFRGDLWAFLLLARSNGKGRQTSGPAVLTRLSSSSGRWTKKEISLGLPESLRGNKRFLKEVTYCVQEAHGKYGTKTQSDNWRLSFLELFVYGNDRRVVERYEVSQFLESHIDDDAKKGGVVYIDTQDCICYPIVKFCPIDGSTFEICSLKDLYSYSISAKTISLHIKRLGQFCSFVFANENQAISFASELDAQCRTVIDYYANLNADQPKMVYSPRADMFQKNMVLPPAMLRENLPGIRHTDDVPQSILTYHPFILQQSSQHISTLKVTFARNVESQTKLDWQLRFFNRPDNGWQITELSDQESFRECHKLTQGATFRNLHEACQALLDELKDRKVQLEHDIWPGETNASGVRLSHIGRSPKVHFIDPDLVEDIKSEKNGQALPVLVSSNELIVPHKIHLADGERSKLYFAAWNSSQYLLREYQGERDYRQARFWLSAEMWTQLSHYGLAPVCGFSPASDFYLLEFASQGPLDVYLTHSCNSAIYLTHLLLAMKTLAKTIAFTMSRSFVHGDIRLANVCLYAHTVEAPVSFTVKLIPPELRDCPVDNTNLVFHPMNRAQKSDIYSFGVTMIQLLRLGHVPPQSDVSSILQDPPNLINFEALFSTSKSEYSQLAARIFKLIKSCLIFNGAAVTPVQFMLNCAEEIDELLKIARNLHPDTLNLPTEGYKFILHDLEKTWNIPSTEISPFHDNECADPAAEFLLLSHGHFGEVLRGVWRHSQPDGSSSEISVALKRIRHERADDPLLQKDRLIREFVIWSNLKHRNIVKVLGLTWLQERPCIVMEYIPEGLTLEKYSQQHRRDKKFFSSMTSLLVQVTEGMWYLTNRNKPIVHCDLAARNVLIGIDQDREKRTLVAKITDFGLALTLDNSAIYCRLTPGEFPKPWMAPEVLNQMKATPASDVYSFGVLCWEVYCQETPVYRAEKSRMFADYRDVPENLQAIVMKCWQKQENLRPNFLDLKKSLEDVLDQFKSHG